MKFEFSIEEVNKLLQALGFLPFAQVFELVDKIRSQAQAQMNAEKGTESV
jgi:hypothetical protein